MRTFDESKNNIQDPVIYFWYIISVVCKVNANKIQHTLQKKKYGYSDSSKDVNKVVWNLRHKLNAPQFTVKFTPQTDYRRDSIGKSSWHRIGQIYSKTNSKCQNDFSTHCGYLWESSTDRRWTDLKANSWANNTEGKQSNGEIRKVLV